MESVQAIKQRFGIIGNDPILNRALEKALKVAPTEISVLVTGESGVGKESIPKITHQFSHRKHVGARRTRLRRLPSCARGRSERVAARRYVSSSALRPPFFGTLLAADSAGMTSKAATTDVTG